MAIEIQIKVNEKKFRVCAGPGRVLEKKTGKGTSYQADVKAKPFLERNSACDLTMDSCLIWQGQTEGGGSASHGLLLQPVSTNSSSSALKCCSITIEDIENLRINKPKTMSLDSLIFFLNNYETLTYR